MCQLMSHTIKRGSKGERAGGEQRSPRKQRGQEPGRAPCPGGPAPALGVGGRGSSKGDRREQTLKLQQVLVTETQGGRELPRSRCGAALPPSPSSLVKSVHTSYRRSEHSRGVETTAGQFEFGNRAGRGPPACLPPGGLTLPAGQRENTV